MFAIETVAVVGVTHAGTACALLASLAGCAVRLHDPLPAALDHGFEALRHRVEVALAAGVLTRAERQRVLDGVLFTPDLEEAATGADLLVDAAEHPGAHPFPRAAELLRATTAVAAAGAAPADAIASRLPQPGRVLGLRLADIQGPVPRLEVVPAGATTAHVLARAEAFASRVNQAARTALRRSAP